LRDEIAVKKNVSYVELYVTCVTGVLFYEEAQQLIIHFRSGRKFQLNMSDALLD
jgi:hypothetical protein